MAKLTLVDINSETGFTADLNANFAAVETALENTVSRDGTLPNALNADVDMNSNRILNLPAPSAPNDVVRYQDLLTAGAINVTGTTAIPDPTTQTGKVLTSVGTTTPAWQAIPAAPLGLDTLVSQGADRILFTDFSASPAGTIGYLQPSARLPITGTGIDISLLGLQSLVDPGFDRILFWDESSGATGASGFLTVQEPLVINGTDLNLKDATLLTLVSPLDTTNDRLLVWDASGASWKTVAPATVTPLTGIAVTKYKTADTDSPVSTNIPVVDPHLANWSLDANGMYAIEGHLIFADLLDSNIDIQFQWASSAALADARMAWICNQPSGIVLYVTETPSGGSNDPLSQIAIITPNADEKQGVVLSGHMLVAGAPSTVSLNWCSRIVGVNVARLYKGSWVRFTKLN